MADLNQLTRHHLETARTSDHGRSAQLLVHDGALRQTLIALVAGTELAEHNSPHAASLQVLAGRVRITGVDSAALAAGEVLQLTHNRHAVLAVDDAAFLLTTVTGVPPDPDPAPAG